jgi:hypothetical protein
MRRFRDALTTFLRPPAAAGSPGLRQPAVALACRDTVLGELQHLSRTVARGWTAPGRTAGCRGGTHPGRAGRARERAGRAAVDPRRPRRRAACGRGRLVARGRRPPSRWEAYRALAWSRLERDQLLGLLADTAEFAAALPYLDSDLARRLLDPATPALRPDGHAGLAAAALTDPAAPRGCCGPRTPPPISWPASRSCCPPRWPAPPPARGCCPPQTPSRGWPRAPRTWPRSCGTATTAATTGNGTRSPSCSALVARPRRAGRDSGFADDPGEGGRHGQRRRCGRTLTSSG